MKHTITIKKGTNLIEFFEEMVLKQCQYHPRFSIEHNRRVVQTYELKYENDEYTPDSVRLAFETQGVERLSENQRNLIISLAAEFMDWPGVWSENDEFKTKSILEFPEKFTYVHKCINDFDKTGEKMTNEMKDFINGFFAIKWPVIESGAYGGSSHIRDMAEFERLEPYYLALICQRS